MRRARSRRCRHRGRARGRATRCRHWSPICPGRALGIAGAGVHGVEEGLSTWCATRTTCWTPSRCSASSPTAALNDLSSVTKIALPPPTRPSGPASPARTRPSPGPSRCRWRTSRRSAGAPGATVNDVLLAAISGGLQRVLGRARRLTATRSPGWSRSTSSRSRTTCRRTSATTSRWCSCRCRWTSRPQGPAGADAPPHGPDQELRRGGAHLRTAAGGVACPPGQIAFFLTNFFANKAVGVLTNVPGPTGLLTVRRRRRATRSSASRPAPATSR